MTLQWNYKWRWKARGEGPQWKETGEYWTEGSGKFSPIADAEDLQNKRSSLRRVEAKSQQRNQYKWVYRGEKWDEGDFQMLDGYSVFLQHRYSKFSGIRITWTSSLKSFFRDLPLEAQGQTVWPRVQDSPCYPAVQWFWCGCAQKPVAREMLGLWGEIRRRKMGDDVCKSLRVGLRKI